MSPAKVFLPKNRITELVRRPGGIPREEALANAEAAVEELRGGSIEGIQDGIQSMESIIGASSAWRLTAKDMNDILKFGDRIILLSETFGFPILARMTMRLCDLVLQMLSDEQGDAEAIRVFVCALRLVAPPNAALSEKESETMTRELSRILAHYGVCYGPESEQRNPNADDK